ncbi:MAG: hypothetical protein A2623_13300 [Caulobacterales bacterium RIFCSPHIGHO2_01_FULL_70_19]|nr:MAG: hypothetical protein A2623_13300 [Caulobacterales bacterium RIFCSPHIGHO2_01_FULL_70_19]
MRIPIACAPLALGLALSACATTGEGDYYNDELRRLAADCEARGGILSPTGSQTGRPAVDNVCKITGETGRAPSGG